jgi:UDP-N-acetylglucosamine 2-epimerase (non-hydrolysing)
MKVVTIVGTRPEVIKLSRVMARLDETTDHVVVHTGQNFDYELNEIFFEELGLRLPDHYLGVAGQTAAETIGNVIIRADEVLATERPDAVLVLGDTNSALSVISAKRRRIPVFHMEAGNRCFDERVPEEINRRIVDHVSDVNMPYTEHARRYLLAEGLPADMVIKTGSPQKEVLSFHRQAIDESTVHERLGVSDGRYFAVSIHREENVDESGRLERLIESLQAVATEWDLPVVLSTHPRTRQRLSDSGLGLGDRILSVPPLGLPDYVALQRRSYCTISDSGTITEESAILGFPAITVREAHERPEGMDEGVVVMAGLGAARVVDAVRLTRARFEADGPPRLPADYDVDHVSWQVVKIILSYRDFVMRRVWYQP